MEVDYGAYSGGIVDCLDSVPEIFYDFVQLTFVNPSFVQLTICAIIIVHFLFSLFNMVLLQ